MSTPNVAILFPGQGAFYHGVLKEVVTCFPCLMDTFEEIDPVSKHAFGQSVSELLFGRLSSQEETAQASSFPLVQLAMYGINVALYRLLTSLGLQPTVLIGYSFGELAAFVCAGAFSLTEGAALVCQRVHALQRHPACQGSMVALKASAARTQELVDILKQQHLVIAVENSEERTMLAGPSDAVERAIMLASTLNIPCTRLQSPYLPPYPFHSTLLQPVVNDFYASIRHVAHQPLQYPVYSPILRRYYRAEDRLTLCLAQHLTQRVYCHEAILFLQSQHINVFVECGALPMLSHLTKHIVKTDEVLAIACLDPKQGECRSLDGALQALHQQELILPARCALSVDDRRPAPMESYRASEEGR